MIIYVITRRHYDYTMENGMVLVDHRGVFTGRDYEILRVVSSSKAANAAFTKCFRDTQWEYAYNYSDVAEFRSGINADSGKYDEFIGTDYFDCELDMDAKVAKFWERKTRDNLTVLQMQEFEVPDNVE